MLQRHISRYKNTVLYNNKYPDEKLLRR